jgi:hypothetical protein
MGFVHNKRVWNVYDFTAALEERPALPKPCQPLNGVSNSVHELARPNRVRKSVTHLSF